MLNRRTQLFHSRTSLTSSVSRNSRHVIYQHKRGLTCGDAFVVVRHLLVVALRFAGFPRDGMSASLLPVVGGGGQSARLEGMGAWWGQACRGGRRSSERPPRRAPTGRGRVGLVEADELGLRRRAASSSWTSPVARSTISCLQLDARRPPRCGRPGWIAQRASRRAVTRSGRVSA